MQPRLQFVATGLILSAVISCSSQAPEPTFDGTWVGTIFTEGNVTTVVNESGSVWGGTATLVEEASIGVESGPDEYMFGSISSVYATDELIYVVDFQVPVVRAYDHAGAFVRGFGRGGQGPGEYVWPSVVTADDEGRVFVYDSRLARINVYAASGDVLGSWPVEDPACCDGPLYPSGHDAIWAGVRERRDEAGNDPRFGGQVIGPSGPQGEANWLPRIEYQRTTYKTADGTDAETPHSAGVVWTPAPRGKLIVGANDRYRFEIHEPGGSKLVVERYWVPTPIPEEQKLWVSQWQTALNVVNGMGGAVHPSQLPEHKPAYFRLIPALSGETWVIRVGASERIADCVENPLEAGFQAATAKPCWTYAVLVDVFDKDGRYLGDVDLPSGMTPYAPHTSIDASRVVDVVQDEAGTVMVKRYRLVLPGDEE